MIYDSLTEQHPEHQARSLMAKLYQDVTVTADELRTISTAISQVHDALPMQIDATADSLMHLHVRQGRQRANIPARNPGDALLRSCNEMRLQMLALSYLFVEQTEERDTLDKYLQEFLGTLVHERSGITYGTTLNNVVIVLPDMHGAESVAAITASFERIERDTLPGNNWILDLSAVKRMPVMVFGSLFGYAEQFRRTGRNIRFAWVSDSLAAGPLFRSPNSPFRLTKRGGFWFSL